MVLPIFLFFVVGWMVVIRGILGMGRGSVGVGL